MPPTEQLPEGLHWFKATVKMPNGQTATIGPVAAPHALDAALNLVIVAHRSQGAMSQQQGRDIMWPAESFEVTLSEPPSQIHKATKLPPRNGGL